jgi:hypothetical protein
MSVDHSEFTIVKTLDKATPKLFSDDAFVLDGTNAGGVQSDQGSEESTAKELPYMEFKLKEVLISGVQQNGDGDDGSSDGLAVDPNNPNTEVDGRDFLIWQRGNVTPGPDDNVVDVPAVQTDDGLLLPAVQDDGLLLPAVQDDGLLLPAVQTDEIQEWPIGPIPSLEAETLTIVHEGFWV